ncbi:hypothetical protein, partial [Halorientalis regularis]
MTEDASDDRDDWPSPGPNEPVPSWDEYDQLREAVHDYLEHDPDDPAWTGIWRALGAVMGEYQRDGFVEAFDLNEPAERSCIRRLITGEDECPCHETRGWEERELETIGARDEPPHSPPHADHKTLWLDEDGEPALYGMHVYPGNIEMITPSKTADPNQQQRNGWMDITRWAREWGLEVGFLPKSWYNLGS